MEIKDWLPYIAGIVASIIAVFTFIKQLKLEKPDLIQKYADLADRQFKKNEELGARIDKLEIENEALLVEIKTMKIVNADLKLEVASLRESNARLTKENGELKKELEGLRDQIRRSQNKNDKAVRNPKSSS